MIVYSCLILLLEYLLFLVDVYIVYIQFYIPLLYVAQSLLWLLTRFDHELSLRAQILKTSTRIHQCRSVLSEVGRVIDYLSFYLCTFGFGMYYSFVGLIPNRHINIVFVDTRFIYYTCYFLLKTYYISSSISKIWAD